MFSSVIGHDRIKKELYNRLKKDSSGTFLFYGPVSVGKRTVAFEASKLILCEKFEEGCSCESCKHFYSNHPDFLYIGGGKDKIKVSDIEGVIDFCQTKPFLSDNKIIVIDNAHNITWGSSNRLLKILEEPPQNFSFFLVTTYPQYILPTIVSRCIRYEFGNLTLEEVVNIIHEKQGFDKKQAQVLGWLASDSSLDVFSKTGQCIQYRNMVIELLLDAKSHSLIDFLDFIDKIEKDDLPLFADLMTLILTDLLLIKNGINVIVNMDIHSKLVKMANQFNEKALLIIVNLFTQTKKNISLNINMGMNLKNIMIKSYNMFMAIGV